MKPRDQILEVWGELACFSRPELKVERFSYPVITPSAARGIYDAIFCKPHRDPSLAQFRWGIKRIEVLAPPGYIALRRNEVQGVVSERNVRRWMKRSERPEPLMADEAPGQRTQRQTMALKNVRYRLHAEIRPWPGFEGRLPALEAQFQRRAARGQCVHQPYLGCREFPAYFELVEPGTGAASPIPWEAEIGWMLYDVFDQSRPDGSNSPPSVSLFWATVHGGVLEVPDYASDEVRKAPGGIGHA